MIKVCLMAALMLLKDPQDPVVIEGFGPHKTRLLRHEHAR